MEVVAWWLKNWLSEGWQSNSVSQQVMTEVLLSKTVDPSSSIVALLSVVRCAGFMCSQLPPSVFASMCTDWVKRGGFISTCVQKSMMVKKYSKFLHWVLALFLNVI